MRRLLPAAALAAALLPGRGEAQTRVIRIEEPEGTMVGVAVTIDAGLAWESASTAGVTQLAARAVVEELRPELASLPAAASVVCDELGTTLLLAAPPERWEEATRRLLQALRTARVGLGAIERARAAMLRGFAFQADSPVEEARAGLRRAIYGVEHPWRRPPCGSRESIATLRPDDVVRTLTTRLDPARSTAAVAGPVDAEAVERVFGSDATGWRLPFLVPGPVPEPARDTVNIDAQTVTTWVGAAYPFGRDADVEALRLLGFRLQEMLSPGPARPTVHAATAELRRHGRGGHLVLWLVTDSRSADTWLRRLGEILEREREEAMEPLRFEALQRRYLGARLLPLSAPEERAREAALQVFFGNAYTPPERGATALTPARLRLAAESLGAPAVVRYGPLQ